jgi:predicted esterase
MMKRGIHKTLIGVAILLCACLSARASHLPSQELTRGAVIEKVVCRADAQQSYALYLPTSYAPGKRWPILYCFDPAARGAVPVGRFKDAAEQYGYIVIGSNNSRNGPSDTLAILNAMLNDTHARFAIDDRRLYAAGFSGGARVACAVGHSLDIAGVIACGGGFPTNLAPSRATPFVLFGTAGTEDFNYPEMRQLARTLDDLGVANRFAVFDGAHDWAPAALCVEAIEWMELQAMKQGRRDKDQRLVDALLNKRAARVRADEAAGKVYDAYLGYAALARDFKGLKDVSEFDRQAAQMKGAKEIESAIKQERKQVEDQARRTKELFTLKETLKDKDARIQALADLRRAIGDLKKKSDEKAASSERVVARRALNQFLVFLSEEARSLNLRKQYEQAAENLSIIAIIAPDNPRVHYNLACAYALNRDKSRALEALQRAIEKGFKDVALLESDKDLDALRADAEFKRMVDTLKQN